MSHPGMNQDDAPRLGIGIIGCGKVGATIGAAWRDAGHAIIGVSATSAASLQRAEEMLPGVPVLPRTTSQTVPSFFSSPSPTMRSNPSSAVW